MLREKRYPSSKGQGFFVAISRSTLQGGINAGYPPLADSSVTASDWLHFLRRFAAGSFLYASKEMNIIR
jgi:hypothetical protein